MDKSQRAKDLLTDIKYAVESGEGEIPVDNNDLSVVSWLVEQAEEIKKRKKYEGFLKSVIKSGEDLNDIHTVEWFCELWGDILKD